MDRAYIKACRKGTKHVYNARIILTGYSGGGKTSLANRLLGEQINVDERTVQRVSLFIALSLRSTGGK